MVSKTMFETHADEYALVDPTGPTTQDISMTPVLTGEDGGDVVHVGDTLTVTFEGTDSSTSAASTASVDSVAYFVQIEDDAARIYSDGDATQTGIDMTTGNYEYSFTYADQQAPVGTVLDAVVTEEFGGTFGTSQESNFLTVTSSVAETATITGTGHATDPLTASFTTSDTSQDVTVYIEDTTTGTYVASQFYTAGNASGSVTFTPTAAAGSSDVGHVYQAIVVEGSDTVTSTGTVTFADAAPTATAIVDNDTITNKDTTPVSINLLTAADAADADDDTLSIGTGATVSATITHNGATGAATDVTADATFDTATGAFTFDPTSLSLQQGDTAAVTVSYNVEDSSQAETANTATFTVDGINYAATHSGSYATIGDDTRDIVVNLLDDVTDPDSTVSVARGSLVVNFLNSHGQIISAAPTTSYSFDPSTGDLTVHGTAFTALQVGQSYQINATYTVTGDSGGGDFTDSRVIVIDGTDQAPTVSTAPGTGTATISETDLPHSFNLTANVTDPDGPAALTVLTTGTNAPTVTVTDSSGTQTTLSASDYTLTSDGTFTLKSDPTTGSYTDKLHFGDHDTIVVSYTVSDDGTNADAKTVSTTETITLNGSAEQVYGNGTFNGTAYADVIYGSYGPVAAAGSGYVTVNPTTVPTADVPATNDTIYAGVGNDTVFGGAGNDVIFGGQGNDVLHGGDGNDSLEGGAGDDTLDGGSGINTATYLQTTGAITVNLNYEVETMTVMLSSVGTSVSGGPSYAVTGAAGNDTLTHIQNVTGGRGNDIITGSNTFNSVLMGNDGNDIIHAGNLAAVDAIAGDQSQLFGNAGNDTLYGGLGNDSINGGAGDDAIFASTGHDIIQGGRDNTPLNSDGSHAAYTVTVVGNQVIGVLGDTLTFSTVTTDGTLHDYTDPNSGTVYHVDGVIASLATTTEQLTYTDANHNAAYDTISGIENLAGSSVDDVLTGDANGNVIGGLGGDDRILGMDGNDTILGGNGNDTIFGNVGNDVLYGQAGDDTINGGQGNDILHGGTGSNTLTGGVGADTFVLSYSTDPSNVTNTTITESTIVNGTPSSVTVTAADTITDFSGSANGGQGDKIDLSEVAATTGESLHFAGNFFTGSAGDVIVTQGNGAGHYLLEIDFDGDGHADFVANVNGLTTTNGTTTTYAAAPVAGDFILTSTATVTQVNALVHIDHHADLFG